jgi:hypothetical protein
MFVKYIADTDPAGFKSLIPELQSGVPFDESFHDVMNANLNDM